MTKREFYVALTETEALSAEMREYAAHLLESFDASTEKRKEAAAKKAEAKRAEKQPIVDAIMAALTSEPQTATSLIEAAGVDTTPQSVSYMMRAPIAEGKVAKEMISVAGKKTKATGYKLVG